MADNYGQIAFEAYNRSRGGKTHDGKDTPGWDALGDGVRHAWGEAALVILGRYEAGHTTIQQAESADAYGQINFEAYNRRRDFKFDVPWNALGDDMRAGWTAGAAAVLKRYEAGRTTTHRVAEEEIKAYREAAEKADARAAKAEAEKKAASEELDALTTALAGLLQKMQGAEAKAKASRSGP